MSEFYVIEVHNALTATRMHRETRVLDKYPSIWAFTEDLEKIWPGQTISWQGSWMDRLLYDYEYECPLNDYIPF